MAHSPRERKSTMPPGTGCRADPIARFGPRLPARYPIGIDICANELTKAAA